jgi:hypothetical protein
LPARPPAHRPPTCPRPRPAAQELAAKQKELLSGYNKVQSARVAARREAIVAKNQAAQEARRQALLRKEEITTRHLERKAEVRGAARRPAAGSWLGLAGACAVL